MVEIGRALMRKAAVVVAETPGEVTLLAKDTTPQPMPLAEFDALVPVEVPGPAVGSAAGRLWRVVLASVTGKQKGKWSVELVDTVAWQIGRVDLPTARASIRDRLALGLECAVDYLPVSKSEMAWYHAHAAMRAGNDRALLNALLSLPRDTYAARTELITARARSLLADESLHSDVVTCLSGLRESDPDAGALSAAFGSCDAVIDPELLEGAARRAAERVGTPVQPLLGVARAVTGFDRVPALPSSPLPTVGAMDVYLAGRDGANLDDQMAAVGLLPLDCADELVDRGAVRVAPIRSASPWHGEVAAYFECRIAPDTVSDDVLADIGFTAETARRAFLRADRPALEALRAIGRGGRAADDVAHYRALLELKDNPDSGTLGSGLRADTVALLECARALAAAAKDGVVEVPESILADSTLWPLLRKAAEGGALTAADPHHELAEAFRVWTQLCGLQRLLFDGQWREVLTGGTDLARRTTQRAFADEALNMAAYASIQLGQIADARRLIDETLAGDPPVGLLVNAAVLAASEGSAATVPHLARIARDAPPAVGRAAVAQAVQGWLEDPRVMDYPAELARLVRTTLAGELEDGFYLELIRLTSYNDGDWLATTSEVAAVGRSQTDMRTFFTARASAFSDKSDSSPSDLFATLASLLKGSSKDEPWLDRERDKAVGMLFDGVATEFGDGWMTAFCVNEMIKGHALSTFAHLTLGPQAAAHLASWLARDNKELSGDFEDRLLFDSLTLYRNRRSELDDKQDDLVRDNLVRCVATTAACFADASGRARNELAEEVNAVIDRMRRVDDVTARRLKTLQLQLLDNFDPYLHRLRRLTRAFDGLPVDTAQRDLRREIEDDILRWEDENERLRRGR